ncbi:MAG: hypothetical protein WBC70_01325 [Candidatus Aminicenantales bacterium]
MSEFTPKEKRKIHEEEKARHEAREEIDQAAKQKANKRAGKQIGIGCLIVLILVILGSLWFSGFFNSCGQKTSFSPQKELAKLLEISIWPKTEKKPLGERTEIWIKGHGSWFPNLKYGGDKRSFGNYKVGEVKEFFLYPDGRNGIEIKVQFKMTAEMISGSDAAVILIDIFDDKVEVVGQAIEGRSVVFKRKK